MLAAETNCTQNRVDGSSIPSTNAYIYPARQLVPFYQWENDNGYCGETSMMQAGMNNGQWMSQFNARLVCRTELSQSGPDKNDQSWCSTHKNIPNYNAQLLIEDPGTGVSGPNPFASAAACLANSRLSAKTYPYATGFRNSNSGLAGYRDYMSWIKNEVIAGRQVTVGLLLRGGADPQYDHEVSVIKIGTNHSVTDPTYYDDDVLYFDDHGAYALVGNKVNKGNPAIPYGSGSDSAGCTPYVFGYSFGSLPHTRVQANAGTAQAYSIIAPGVYPTNTSTGADGFKGVVAITGHNYAFSVAGAADDSVGGPYLLPIQVELLNIPPDSSATFTNGAANPKDPVAGWRYENSMIGTDIYGLSCTNKPPQYPMVPIDLQVKVSGLTPGATYNLYEYDFATVDLVPAHPALAVPTQNFNASAGMATMTRPFTASGPTYALQLRRRSDQIVVFRAVPANAP
jgi:hypothetical protein